MRSNADFLNATTEVLSVTIQLPVEQAPPFRLIPKDPVQFVFLENKTTYSDWVTFSVDSISVKVRCFDVDR